MGWNHSTSASLTVASLIFWQSNVITAKEIKKSVTVRGWGIATPGGSSYFVD
jgi:hypothetical protein